MVMLQNFGDTQIRVENIYENFKNSSEKNTATKYTIWNLQQQQQQNKQQNLYIWYIHLYTYTHEYMKSRSSFISHLSAGFLLGTPKQKSFLSLQGPARPTPRHYSKGRETWSTTEENWRRWARGQPSFPWVIFGFFCWIKWGDKQPWPTRKGGLVFYRFMVVGITLIL